MRQFVRHADISKVRNKMLKNITNEREGEDDIF